MAPIFGALAGNWIGLTVRSVKLGALARVKAAERLVNFSTQPVDDLATALETMRRRQGNQLTQLERDSTLRSSVVAGSDPIATTVTMALWFLNQHPYALAKLKSSLNTLHDRYSTEIRAVKARSIPLREADKSSYLRWVLLEVLRRHSPFGHHLPRVVPHGGMSIGPYYLPAGVGDPSTSRPRMKLTGAIG